MAEIRENQRRAKAVRRIEAVRLKDLPADTLEAAADLLAPRTPEKAAV